MPVPTRKNSLRWVETYVGFEDESELLLSLFLKVFTDTSEQHIQKTAQPVAALEHIRTQGRAACYEVPDEGLFYFHDHERRMPWQISEQGRQYYTQQKTSLRRAAYIRLCENRWQKSAGDYLEPDWIERAKTLTHVEKSNLIEPMVIAIDASQRHDTTSIVGVVRRESGAFEVPFVDVYDPHGVDIDLDRTVADTIIGLVNRGLVKQTYNEQTLRWEYEIWYDPFQMHQVAMNLRAKHIDCFEFAQGTDRTLADTFLFKQFRDENIAIIDSPDLDAHLTAAKAREIENEQVRIVKGTRTNAGRVDAAVATSMAVWRAESAAQRTEPAGQSILAQDIADSSW
jgi:hypothetical protein